MAGAEEKAEVVHSGVPKGKEAERILRVTKSLKWPWRMTFPPSFVSVLVERIVKTMPCNYQNWISIPVSIGFRLQLKPRIKYFLFFVYKLQRKTRVSFRKFFIMPWTF